MFRIVLNKAESGRESEQREKELVENCRFITFAVVVVVVDYNNDPVFMIIIIQPIKFVVITVNHLVMLWAFFDAIVVIIGTINAVAYHDSNFGRGFQKKPILFSANSL